MVAQDYMMKIREGMEVSFHVTVCLLAVQTSASFMCGVFEMVSMQKAKPTVLQKCKSNSRHFIALK